MQDPLITLRSALYAAWGLAGDLAKANIKFTTGRFDKNFGSYQVSILLVTEGNAPAALGGSVYRVTSTYQIDVWVKYSRVTNYGAGKAKDYLWDMKEEVKRIIKLNQTGLTGLMWTIMNGPGREIPEPEQTPPMLHWSFDVEVAYEI